MLEISVEDFCILVAISELSLPQDVCIEREFASVLPEVIHCEESLRKLCQNVLLSSIYSSQVRDIKVLGKEIASIDSISIYS